MLLPNYSPQEVVFTGLAVLHRFLERYYYCKYLIQKTSTRNRDFDRTDKTDMYQGNIITTYMMQYAQDTPSTIQQLI